MAVFRLIFRQLATVSEHMNHTGHTFGICACTYTPILAQCLLLVLAKQLLHVEMSQYMTKIETITVPAISIEMRTVHTERFFSFYHWWWHATKFLFHQFICLDFELINVVLSHVEEPHWINLWQEKVPTRIRYDSQSKATNQFDLWEIRKLHFDMWWNFIASNNSFISITHRLSNCRIHMQPIQLHKSDSHDSTQIRMCEFLAKWMSALPTLEIRKWRQ